MALQDGWCITGTVRHPELAKRCDGDISELRYDRCWSVDGECARPDAFRIANICSDGARVGWAAAHSTSDPSHLVCARPALQPGSSGSSATGPTQILRAPRMDLRSALDAILFWMSSDYQRHQRLTFFQDESAVDRTFIRQTEQRVFDVIWVDLIEA